MAASEVEAGGPLWRLKGLLLSPQLTSTSDRATVRRGLGLWSPGRRPPIRQPALHTGVGLAARRGAGSDAFVVPQPAARAGE